MSMINSLTLWQRLISSVYYIKNLTSYLAERAVFQSLEVHNKLHLPELPESDGREEIGEISPYGLLQTELFVYTHQTCAQCQKTYLGIVSNADGSSFPVLDSNPFVMFCKFKGFEKHNKYRKQRCQSVPASFFLAKGNL